MMKGCDLYLYRVEYDSDGCRISVRMAARGPDAIDQVLTRCSSFSNVKITNIGTVEVLKNA